MQTSYLSYRATNKFSPVVVDYLAEKATLKPFYHRFSNADSFSDQIAEKQSSYTHRETLIGALKKQHATTNSGANLIERLQSTHCYTVTTGHQLCLFTGPLYFIYKIVSTIKLAEKLRSQHQGKDVVPVFWMATEDHDFDEVNHLHINNQKVIWESGQGGAVGRMKLVAIADALNEVDELLTGAPQKDVVMDFLRKTFASEEMTLAEATRNLVYEIFGPNEILVVDGDDRELKRLFAPIVQRELTEHFSFKAISKTNSALEKHYPLQVTPREINLFYLGDQLRERIVFRDGQYVVLHTSISFSKEEILAELDAYPERFSPNVALRPLYQEVILPNLSYIGGGGELAYWFQLKGVFDAAQVPFPVLLLRNSVLWATRSETRKMEHMNLQVADLFQDREELIKTMVHQKSEHELSLENDRNKLAMIFREISSRAAKSDPTFEKMVLADGARAAKMLVRIEKRMMKAEKLRHGLTIDRINHIFDRLFPGGGLQERSHNFFEYYARYGTGFLKTLMEELDPLQLEFAVIEER